MDKFQNRVMVNVHADDDRSFIAVTNQELATRLQGQGWSTVYIKEFQFRVVNETLEVPVSKPEKDQAHGQHQLYNKVTVASLASSLDCDEFGHAARSLFGAFGEDDRVFWRTLPMYTDSPRTCGVFRKVDEFTPTGHRDDYILTFNLENIEQMLNAQVATEQDRWGPKAEAIYKSERSLVYQALSDF